MEHKGHQGHHIRVVPLTLPIREIVPATPRARVVRLDLNGQPFDYAAGQAAFVGRHGQADRRPYSLAASAEDARRDGWLEFLVGIEDGGQPGPHLTLQPGALVDVEGPIGAFTFPSDPVERRFVFIAGGTGIAPLRAMLHHALGIPHRDIGLFYSARTPDEFAFQSEFQAMAEAGDITLRQTVTRANEMVWSGSRGRLDRVALSELVHDPATLCFVCGPPALVADMPGVLGELGIPRERIRMEEWGTT
jgi:glycine betaine catabolism B